MKKIYFWANNLNENSGEGILASNFIKLLKIKYKKYNLININKNLHKSNFYFNYVSQFFGIIDLWKYHLKGEKICYINYLPIWNFFIFLFLPKNTIFGPITGTNSKKNFLYIFLKYIGISYLKNNRKKNLFSHNQFKKYFRGQRNFYNFLIYDFKIHKKSKKKKYDLIFYYRNNRNKGNDFLLEIIKNISNKYKIAIVGDKIKNFTGNLNIKSFGNIKRQLVFKIIEQSRFALMTKENNLSYFALDCISKNLEIFSNKDLKLDNSIRTNLYIYISFENLKKTIKIINEKLKETNKKKYFNFNQQDFLKYFD